MNSGAITVRKSLVFRVFITTFLCFSPSVSMVEAGGSLRGTQTQVDAEYSDHHVANLVYALETRDIPSILEVTNSIKSSGYSDDALSFVLDLWNENLDEYPSIDRSIVQNDIVKLEFVDILAQAKIAGFIDVELDQLHEFAAIMLYSEDVGVLTNALLVIHLFNDPNDIPRISELATSGNVPVFRTSVVALILICDDKANAALEHVFDGVNTDEQRNFIVETRDRLTKFRKC